MTKYKVGAYVRLSKDDNYSESDSIKNQKSIIKDYINENEEFELVDYYIDNGYSGTNFNRPAFAQMCFDIVKKKINCVIVKDMSRFGRDSGWVKIYLGETFPEHNIRFISINDKLDSLKTKNYTDSLEFALLNLTYEHYAIDISNKVTSIKHFQQKRGDFIGISAPYGYLKDPNNCHKFIIDKYAATIVKRIFDMTLECKSRKEIVDILNEEKILPPSKYKAEVIKVTSEATMIAKEWTQPMIRQILTNEAYIGNMYQGKMKKPVRRLNKRVKTKKEDWVLVENTHEPIISKNDFETVQRMLEYSPTMLKSDDVLLRYLKCPDCGSYFYKKKTKYNIYYYCNNYRKKKCTNHSVIKSILESLVLEKLEEKNGNNIKLNDKILNNCIKHIYVYDNGKIMIDFKC